MDQAPLDGVRGHVYPHAREVREPTTPVRLTGSQTDQDDGYQQLVTTTLIYSLLSSTLSVVNKYTLDKFPFPAFVLAVQLTSSASVIRLGSELGFVNLSSVSWKIILGFVPLTISFFFLLASSLLLMAKSPFNVFLICKSLTPFFMSLSETLYFRTPCPSLQSFMAMTGMAIGSVLYTRYDEHFSASYLLYAALFICCSVFEGLIAKQTIEKFALNQTTRTLLMNALACPIAIIWTLCTEATAATQIKLSSVISLGISCALGLGMGIATMQMRTICSATFVAIVGVCNKFLSLGFASLVLSGSPSFQSTLSTAFVLLCSSFYNGNSAKSTFLRWDLMRTCALALILFMMSTGTLNERLFVTKPPSTNNDGSSATSGKLFSGSKTRLVENPRGTGKSRTFVKSSWRNSGIGQCDHFAVVTTIFAPSEAVIDSCRRLSEYQGCLLIIGDAKGPANYTLSPTLASCSYKFVSYDEQQNFGGSFARALPHNHFGRKNLGYIAAIQNGATSVWDFDDDNIFINDKMGTFLQSKKKNTDVQVIQFSQPLGDVLNPYLALGSTHFAWPRGFPLTEIKNEAKTPKRFNIRHVNASLQNIGVVQALANHDPDVDAIYRLQRKLPLNFLTTSEAVILPVPLGTMSPFNAQATLWASSDVFWGLYLPVSVHGRVSDIWRSYIFQRLAKEFCIQVAFSVSPWVEQRRNAHSYIADLDAEHDLYFKTERLLEFLSAWSPSGKSRLLSDMFVELYIALYEREYVDAADVQLSRKWMDELRNNGYPFPNPVAPCHVQQPEVKTGSSLRNTTFVVRINHRHGALAANRYLEVWSDALQKYGVSHVVFYGGNLKVEDINRPFGVLNIHICENEDDARGFFWYHLNCSNMLNLNMPTSTRGYMFAHDDAALDFRSLSESGDSNQSWFTFVQNPIVPYDIMNASRVQEDPWTWIKSEGGAPAILRALDDADFLAMYNTSLWTCTPNLELNVGRGQSDVFFISSRQYSIFKEAASLFAKHKVFLEIAVPTIAACLLGEFQTISLYTSWDNTRGQPPPTGAKANVFHPLKLSNQVAYDFVSQFARDL